MTRDPQPQPCPAEDCTATYAAPVLEATERLCPECNEPVIECPACETIVRLGDVWDWRWSECPECQTHRLDLAAIDRGELTAEEVPVA